MKRLSTPISPHMGASAEQKHRVPNSVRNESQFSVSNSPWSGSLANFCATINCLDPYVDGTGHCLLANFMAG